MLAVGFAARRLVAAAAVLPVSDGGRFRRLALSELPRSNTLPAIWIDPTTMAMMLAAMNSDLTRFIILARSDAVSGSSRLGRLRRAARGRSVPAPPPGRRGGRRR